MTDNSISIVIPAKNELPGLKVLLPELRKLFPEEEIIVVDDGSSDDTEQFCLDKNVLVAKHPYSKGNGASIKTGARLAKGDIILFMDGDGQHKPDDIKKLIEKFNSGFDMVVGARSSSSQASIARLCANTFYNWFASIIVGQKVEDLTSGFRIVNANYFKKIIHLLPNGFSYPTTSTMAFFRSGYSVGYVPIEAKKRIGENSHIKLFKDGIRFLLILFKIGTLYSPLKIFFPCSAAIFITGISYYAYTYLTMGRFTNMSALLITTSITIFLMGLVSEQITNLMYSRNND